MWLRPVIVEATYDSVYKAPRCTTTEAGCDSTTLLNGRATLGPETNAPNTIGATCADGTSGRYHVDESNDRIRVLTTDGTTMAAGKTVRIEATVWAYSRYSSEPWSAPPDPGSAMARIAGFGRLFLQLRSVLAFRIECRPGMGSTSCCRLASGG